MKQKSHLTSFYVETLLMVLIFTGMIVLLSSVFSLARVQSVRSRRLTNAVCLAQNAAEAVAASTSVQDVLEILEEENNGELTEENGSPAAVFLYDDDMNADAGGVCSVTVTWEKTDRDDFVVSNITVAHDGENAPVYELRTGVWIPGGAQ